MVFQAGASLISGGMVITGAHKVEDYVLVSTWVLGVSSFVFGINWPELGTAQPQFLCLLLLCVSESSDLWYEDACLHNVQTRY